MGEEKMGKGSTFGKSIRKRFSDITNHDSQNKSALFFDRSSYLGKEQIDHLVKENAGLTKLITEKNKVIEMNGIELQKVRVVLQKLQSQNWNLAQSNSHMMAEINLGKKKVKELEHQLACKDALMKTMNTEFQVKRETNDKKCESKVKHEMNNQKCESKDGEKSVTNQQNASRRIRPGRSRCKRVINHIATYLNLLLITVDVFAAIGQLTTVEVSEKELVENKRQRVRRQSARFTSQHEPDENLFEIKDLIKHENYGPTSKVDIEQEQEHDKCGSKLEPQNSQRMSFGRPSRRAAEKVQSYKEVPVNLKMRRPE